MNHNNMNGALPTEFGNMRSLGVIELGFNGLSGAVPTEFGNCANLWALGFYGNEGLTGRVDELLGALPAGLMNLYAGGTLLGGSVPSTVGRFFQMETLVLQKNRLTGTVPSEIGQIPTLMNFDLFGNQCDGTLPSELGLLGAATTLNFASNNFNGTLAPEFVGWRSLETLVLSDNSFSGSPSVLADLPLLRTLYMSGNQFTDLGGLCDVGHSWISFAANGCDSEQFECSCCTQCCNLDSCTALR